MNIEQLRSYINERKVILEQQRQASLSVQRPNTKRFIVNRAWYDASVARFEELQDLEDKLAEFEETAE